MTVHVVDPLEAVQVEHEHAVAAARARGRCEGGGQGLLELAAVGQAGERVLIGQRPGLVFGGQATAGLALLLRQASQGERQQAGDEQAAKRQDLVQLQRQLVGIGVALAVEDVELEGVERRRRQQKKQDRAVLDADPMTHDEPSGCGPQMGETHGPASGLLP